MIDHDCIFCKIASGEIPSKTLYEDNEFRVILDISPASKGHAIILPKTHITNIFDIEEPEASKLLLIVKKVASAMKEYLHYDGINILQNNGKAAGQTVFHLHVHLIPRYKEDTISIGWIPTKPSEEELTTLAKEIQNVLN